MGPCLEGGVRAVRPGALTGFQRAVILVAAILIALRLFAPVRYIPNENAISYVPGVWVGSISTPYVSVDKHNYTYGYTITSLEPNPDFRSGMWIGSSGHPTRILTSITVFQVLGIAILATAICLLFPRSPRLA